MDRGKSTSRGRVYSRGSRGGYRGRGGVGHRTNYYNQSNEYYRYKYNNGNSYYDKSYNNNYAESYKFCGNTYSKKYQGYDDSYNQHYSNGYAQNYSNNYTQSYEDQPENPNNDDYSGVHQASNDYARPPTLGNHAVTLDGERSNNTFLNEMKDRSPTKNLSATSLRSTSAYNSPKQTGQALYGETNNTVTAASVPVKILHTDPVDRAVLPKGPASKFSSNTVQNKSNEMPEVTFDRNISPLPPKPLLSNKSSKVSTPTPESQLNPPVMVFIGASAPISAHPSSSSLVVNFKLPSLTQNITNTDTKSAESIPLSTPIASPSDPKVTSQENSRSSKSTPLSNIPTGPASAQLTLSPPKAPSSTLSILSDSNNSNSTQTTGFAAADEPFELCANGSLKRVITSQYIPSYPGDDTHKRRALNPVQETSFVPSTEPDYINDYEDNYSGDVVGYTRQHVFENQTEYIDYKPDTDIITSKPTKKVQSKDLSFKRPSSEPNAVPKLAEISFRPLNALNQGDKEITFKINSPTTVTQQQPKLGGILNLVKPLDAIGGNCTTQGTKTDQAVEKVLKIDDVESSIGAMGQINIDQTLSHSDASLSNGKRSSKANLEANNDHDFNAESNKTKGVDAPVISVKMGAVSIKSEENVGMDVALESRSSAHHTTGDQHIESDQGNESDNGEANNSTSPSEDELAYDKMMENLMSDAGESEDEPNESSHASAKEAHTDSFVNTAAGEVQTGGVDPDMEVDNPGIALESSADITPNFDGNDKNSSDSAGDESNSEEPDKDIHDADKKITVKLEDSVIEQEINDDAEEQTAEEDNDAADDAQAKNGMIDHLEDGNREFNNVIKGHQGKSSVKVEDDQETGSETATNDNSDKENTPPVSDTDGDDVAWPDSGAVNYDHDDNAKADYTVEPVVPAVSNPDASEDVVNSDTNVHYFKIIARGGDNGMSYHTGKLKKRRIPSFDFALLHGRTINLPSNVLELFGYGKGKDEDGVPYLKTLFDSVISNFSLFKVDENHVCESDLNIYKFDHTMVCTLTPNPELYTADTYRDLLSTKQYRYNWYNQVLPALEYSSKVRGGVAETCGSKYYHAKLKKLRSNRVFERPDVKETLETLNFAWSSTLLNMVKNNNQYKTGSNMLLIDRQLGDESKLFHDLKILSKYGYRFDYVINSNFFYTMEQYTALSITLLDEILNNIYPWSRNIKNVTFFEPTEIGSKIFKEDAHVQVGDIRISMYYTAGRCSYIRQPSVELRKVYETFTQPSRSLGKISLSCQETGLRLQYHSIDVLTSYLHTVDMVPESSTIQDYHFNFSDLPIWIGNLPYNMRGEFDERAVYEGTIVKYGKISDSLYAVQLMVSGGNTTWLYDNPIMVIARNKRVNALSVKSYLKSIQWTISDSKAKLYMKFFSNKKIKITRNY